MTFEIVEIKRRRFKGRKKREKERYAINRVVQPVFRTVRWVNLASGHVIV